MVNSNIGDEEEASYLRVYHSGRKQGGREPYKVHQFIACCFQKVLMLERSEGVRQRIEYCFNFKIIKILSARCHKGSNKFFTTLRQGRLHCTSAQR